MICIYFIYLLIGVINFYMFSDNYHADVLELIFCMFLWPIQLLFWLGMKVADLVGRILEWITMH